MIKKHRYFGLTGLQINCSFMKMILQYLIFCYIAGSCAPDSDDWKFYNGQCYLFTGKRPSQTEADTSEFKWYNAEDACRQYGGHLVSIHTLDEQRFIEGQVKNQRRLIVILLTLRFTEIALTNKAFCHYCVSPTSKFTVIASYMPREVFEYKVLAIMSGLHKLFLFP